jgi:hypothetical protein
MPAARPGYLADELAKLLDELADDRKVGGVAAHVHHRTADVELGYRQRLAGLGKVVPRNPGLIRPVDIADGDSGGLH